MIDICKYLHKEGFCIKKSDKYSSVYCNYPNKCKDKEINKLEMKYLVLKLNDNFDIEYLIEQLSNVYADKNLNNYPNRDLIIKDISLILVNSILKLK